MVLLDVEKAFDRVWIDGIIYKMIKQGYPKAIIKIIHSYITGRALRVSINDQYSTNRTISAGVPRGSVLGPILFNIFLNDTPKFSKTKLAVFADDTAVYAHSFSAIVAAKQTQIHINILEEYYSKWKIKINADKAEVITFTRKYKEAKIIQTIKFIVSSTYMKTQPSLILWTTSPKRHKISTRLSYPTTH